MFGPLAGQLGPFSRPQVTDRSGGYAFLAAVIPDFDHREPAVLCGPDQVNNFDRAFEGGFVFEELPGAGFHQRRVKGDPEHPVVRAQVLDSALMPEPPKPLEDAVAEATEAASLPKPARRRRAGKAQDVFGGEMRRRDLIPLLIFHLIRDEPSYGNQLIDAIEKLTQGVISVNPNTMYPLLRDLESRGLIEGSWEHPDKRTRRFYAITPAGEKAYGELRPEIEPFLDSVIRSVTLIKAEVYGDRG